jgi:hypothetical protein
MARSRSFDGSFDDMPLSIQRAASVDRSYYAQALCINERNGTPKIAWLATPGKRYRVGANLYDGDKLIELALTTCSICPVQWECTRTAIDADERWGIWGDTLDNIAWLERRSRDLGQSSAAVLDGAKALGHSVQVTITRLRVAHAEAC